MSDIREWIASFEADVASRNYTKLGIKAHQCTPLWVADQIISYLTREGVLRYNERDEKEMSTVPKDKKP